MVRWQNQEDPGYTTPSSSEEDVDEYTPKNSCRSKQTHSNRTSSTKKNNFPSSRLKFCVEQWRKGQDGLTNEWYEQEVSCAGSSGGGFRAEEHESTLNGHFGTQSFQHSPRKNWPRFHFDDNVNFDWYRSNFYLYPEHRNPPLINEIRDESVYAHQDPEWWSLEATCFPMLSPPKSMDGNMSNVESFPPLNSWDYYLVTPEKSRDSNMESQLTSSPRFSSPHADLPRAYSCHILSPPLSGLNSSSLKLDNQEQYFSPLPAFSEDYIVGLSVDECRLSDLNKSPIYCKEQDYSDSEENNWQYRVLFPPE